MCAVRQREQQEGSVYLHMYTFCEWLAARLIAWGETFVKTLNPLLVGTFSYAGDVKRSTLKSLFVYITHSCLEQF